jgi:hypothetical protein
LLYERELDRRDGRSGREKRFLQGFTGRSRLALGGMRVFCTALYGEADAIGRLEAGQIGIDERIATRIAEPISQAANVKLYVIDCHRNMLGCAGGALRNSRHAMSGSYADSGLSVKNLSCHNV